MEKITENWRNQFWYEKVIHIIGFFAAIGAIVLPLLDLLGICDDMGKIFIPLLAVLMFIQAFDNRKACRKLMIFSLCTAIVIAACWLAVILLS